MSKSDWKMVERGNYFKALVFGAASLAPTSDLEVWPAKKGLRPDHRSDATVRVDKMAAQKW
jgi:hypothetical protein